MNGVTIKKFFETKYPKDLAYEWDNVGLQIGTLNKEITGILIALDVTKDVLKEAIKKRCNVIIAHHPLIFKPMKNILSDSYKGSVIETLLKEDIAVYVSHTNYDLGHSGMNTVLANKLNLKNPEILEYETETHGIGKIGDFEPMPLKEALKVIKERLNIQNARLISNKRDDKVIKKIAISGGSGASHMAMAKFKGADLYITGDVSYHQAHDMLQMGLSTLDIGHYVEKHFMDALKEELSEAGVDAPIYTSSVDLDPFTFV